MELQEGGVGDAQVAGRMPRIAGGRRPPLAPTLKPPLVEPLAGADASHDAAARLFGLAEVELHLAGRSFELEPLPPLPRPTPPRPPPRRGSLELLPELSTPPPAASAWEAIEMAAALASRKPLADEPPSPPVSAPSRSGAPGRGRDVAAALAAALLGAILGYQLVPLLTWLGL